MTRRSLVNIIRQLLKTAETLDFLLHVDDDDLRTLISCIRDSKDFDSEPAEERRERTWFYGKKYLILL